MFTRTLQHLVKRSNTSYLGPIFARFEGTNVVPKVSDPLRILFCGSDGFSSASLRALRDYQIANPEAITSIDVLCRPGKPSGRGLKTIREPLIKSVAQELGLPIHERDTFTKWELPKPDGESINLIIAVSFGLFVPPRILKSTKYGGINLHPSLLPDFRGAAPLQHTLMAGVNGTGVTLQTLDEKSFDHGIILAQSPNTVLRSIRKLTYDELLAQVTTVAADLLIQGLKDKVYVPPLELAERYKKYLLITATQKRPLYPAPKITPEDRQVDWQRDPFRRIMSRHNALGRLWSYVCIDNITDKRFIFEDLSPVPTPSILKTATFEHFIQFDSSLKHQASLLSTLRQRESHGMSPTEPELLPLDPSVRFMVYRGSLEYGPAHRHAILYIVDGDDIIIRLRDSQSSFRIKTIKVEGRPSEPARKAMQGIADAEIWRLVRQKANVFAETRTSTISKTKNIRKVMTDRAPENIPPPMNLQKEKGFYSVTQDGWKTDSPNKIPRKQQKT